MAINIGQLIKSVMADSQPGDPKTLELKVGQIVKGLIVQMLSDKDALVNISGVLVKVLLEVPLAQGNIATLQVQPHSVSGQVILKPVANITGQLAGTSLTTFLKDLGLKPEIANRQAVQTLQQAQVPLTTDNIQAFSKAMAQIPVNINPNHWQHAVILAFQRGLPISLETMQSLNQVLYGKPVDQQLKQIMLQIEPFLFDPQLPAETHSLLIQVKQTLSQMQQLTTPQDEISSAHAENTAITKQTPMLENSILSVRTSTDSKQAVQGLLNEPISESISESISTTISTTISDSVNVPPAKEQTMQQGLKIPVTPLKADFAPANIDLENNDPTVEKTWVSKWLQSLGVDHEQQVFKLLSEVSDRGKGTVPMSLLNEDSNALIQTLPGVGLDSIKQDSPDSLKSVLLQLTSLASTPVELHDSAQQLLQQITGQQLLLSSNHNSMFSNITLMIPMMNAAGQMTASINIQSRKGKNGKMDAKNCRLLFGLNMESMGSTLVEVQVYNKAVSIHVHNDHAFVAELLESSKGDVSESLQKAGYQFLSMKVTPFPEITKDESTAEQGNELLHPDFYEVKPYKGVDLRV